MARTALIAIGGNSLIRAGEKGTIAEQIANTRRTAQGIVQIIRAGYHVVVTHGNGPQVGAALLRSERAADQVYTHPLDVCDAAVKVARERSEGTIEVLMTAPVSGTYYLLANTGDYFLITEINEEWRRGRDYELSGAWDPVVTWAAGRLADYWVPTGYGGDLLLVAGTAVESAGIGMFLAALQRGYLRFRGPLQR